MGALVMNLLSVRRLVELLSKVTVLRFEIVVLMKETQARFVTSLVWSISRWWSGAFECELLKCFPRWLEVL
jgi:hypothetical protein